MQIKKKRWFKDISGANKRGLTFEETLTFGLAGTSGIEMSDPRLRPIGQIENGIDLWLLLGISNPAYTVPDLPHNVTFKKRLNPNTHIPETIPVRGGPILNAAYYNSPYWDPYSLPIISSDFEEITEDEHFVILSDLATAQQQAREDALLNLTPYLPVI